MLLNIPQVKGTTLAEAITAFYVALSESADLGKVKEFAEAVQNYVYIYSTMANPLIVSAEKVHFFLGDKGEVTLDGVYIDGLPTGRSIMVSLTPVSMIIPPDMVIWMK